jgi:hypothetical protein
MLYDETISSNVERVPSMKDTNPQTPSPVVL